jgi:oligosaccharyltransferase complex subunit gamma
MYTRIRGVPYVGSDGNWIAGGFQHQFGQEVPVIAAICQLNVLSPSPSIKTKRLNIDGLLSAAFLMLIVIIPRQSSPMRQKVQVYLWTAIVIIMYSVLVSIFRVKNRGEIRLPWRQTNADLPTGYPFKLLV